MTAKQMWDEACRRRGGLRLRAKMILGFGLLSVAILILLQLAHQYGIPLTSLRGEYQQHKALALQHMNFVADLKKEQLERWAARRKDDVTAFSESSFVRSAITNLSAALKALQGQATDPSRVREELARHPAHAYLLHQIHLVKENYEKYQNVMVVEASSGLVLASTDGEQLGTRLTLPAPDTGALPTNNHAIIAMATDAPRGGHLLHLSRCICQEDTPLAVVIFTIHPDEALHPILRTGAELGMTGEAVLLGPDGRAATPLKFAAGLAHARHLFEKHLSDQNESAAPENFRVLTEKDYRGAVTLAVRRPLKVTAGSTWGLVVKQDAAEILAPLHESERFTLVLGLIGLGLAMALSCIAADRLARPLRHLSRTAELVRAGSLSARAKVPAGDDEIGVLAATFNAMVERIERSHQELEHEVRARTAELRQANESLRAEVMTRGQAEAALRRERDNFLRLLGSMQDGVYVVNRSYEVEYVNPTIEREFGPVKGRKCYEYLHARTEVCPWCRNPEVWAGNTVQWEWRSERNGRTYDLLDTPLVNEDRTISKLEIFRDITDRKQAQEALRHAKNDLELRIQERTAELLQANQALTAEVAERARAQQDLRRANQALKTLSSCNEILVRTTTEQQLLNRIVETIVEGHGYCCSWVGLVRHDPQRTLRVAAHAGFDSDYFASVQLTWANTSAGQTPAAEAIRSARPVVTRPQSFALSSSCARRNPLNLDRVSSIALPLITSGQSLGALMIYSGTPQAFEGDEICLLTELADDLAYGIHALRTRAEYERATAELQKWVQVFQRAGWGVAVSSAEGTTFEMINPAYARMHGWTVSEMVGRPIADVCAPESRDELQQQVRIAQERGRTMFEARHVRKDGSTFPVLVDISTVCDESGNILHRVLYTEDITELKSLEARIVEVSEREQQRIGRDLHDGLCQQLAGVAYLCNGIQQDISQVLPEHTARLDRVRQLLQDALTQAHGLAHGLHPVSGETEALMSALRQLTVYFQQVYRISARFDCPQPVLIANNTTAMHLYRIAQEAMNNAVKHGRATHITVRLVADSQRLTLSIRDDGEGFPAIPANHTGIGLQTMRFRARSLSGTLEVQHGSPRGTVVICTLPSSAQHPSQALYGPKPC